MLKTITLTVLAISLTFGADEKPKQPSFADEAFNKAVDAGAGDAIKAYSDYITSLDVANKKVLKALEAVKKDLNDTSKNKSMSIADRADAIKAIEDRILAVKESGVGEAVQGRVVLKSVPQYDSSKMFPGKWVVSTEAGWRARGYFDKTGSITFVDNTSGSWTFQNGEMKIVKGEITLTVKINKATGLPVAGGKGHDGTATSMSKYE